MDLDKTKVTPQELHDILNDVIKDGNPQIINLVCDYLLKFSNNLDELEEEY
jgi:hypothetical protein